MIFSVKFCFYTYYFLVIKKLQIQSKQVLYLNLTLQMFFKYLFKRLHELLIHFTA